jgi:hypothetical protein
MMMTDEVLDFLSGLQEACRRGQRTKVEELSFEAWLEIKSNRWAIFESEEGREIRGTHRLAYSRCMDGYVRPTRKGLHGVCDEHENRFALALLDRMGYGGSGNCQGDV